MPIQDFHAPDFSLRQLQYAVAVAETGSFIAAASLCGVSQPSLSTQVAKLEGVLDVQLFVRGSKGVSLSPAGEQLLPLFKSALKAGSEVEAAAATLQDPNAIPLRIAVIPTVAPYLVPAFTRAMMGEAGPRIHWLELQTAVAEASILSGQADAILIADPPSDAGLMDHLIGWEPFMVVMSGSDSAPDQVSTAWLHDKPLLLLDDGHCLREQTLSLCSLPGGLQSPFRATSLGTMVQMVAAGFGLSVIPAMAVSVETSRAHLLVRPFEDGKVGRLLRLAYSPSHPLAPQLAVAGDRMAALMRENAQP